MMTKKILGKNGKKKFYNVLEANSSHLFLVKQSP